MRKTIIAGNWKMYKTITQAIELANGLRRELFQVEPEEFGILSQGREKNPSLAFHLNPQHHDDVHFWNHFSQVAVPLDPQALDLWWFHGLGSG